MADSHLKVPWIETPLVRSTALSRAAGCNNSNIYLKLENLQPSGSFKSRGIGNFMRSRLIELASRQSTNGALPEAVHFYSSSGGNAGLGCVHAAVTLGYPAIIVVPLSTSAYMISKLKAAGAAEVLQQGKSWAEADQYLVEHVLPEARARGETAIYVPPFDAKDVWAGNATMIHEVSKQLPVVDVHYPTSTSSTMTINGDKVNRTSPSLDNDLDAVVCSVGGGGLFCGVMQGLEDVEMKGTKVLAVETLGAESLSQSVKAGHLVKLPGITSIATSLGARQVCQQAFEYGMKESVATVVLTDAEAVDGCKRFLEDERILVEPACGVCIALCYDGRLKKLIPGLKETSKVVIVVCGGSNISFDIMVKYVKEFCT